MAGGKSYGGHSPRRGEAKDMPAAHKTLAVLAGIFAGFVCGYIFMETADSVSGPPRVPVAR